jgi:putative peptidoglycan lipid II flippase
MPTRSAPYGRLWFIVFVGALAVGALVQFLVVPHLLAPVPGAPGLLPETDSIAYHRDAVQLAARIRTEGWSAWELLPRDQLMIGLSAAVYAALWSEPWTMIPFAAAAHATAALILVRILLEFTDDWRVAALAALPFAAFPAAMSWYTQILKDGYFILGSMMFLLGWVMLAAPRIADTGLRRPATAIVLIGCGFVIMALARFFSLTLMLAVAAALAMLILFFLARALRHRTFGLAQFASAALIVLFAVFVLWGIRDTFLATKVVQASNANVIDRVNYATDSWKPQASILPKAVERPFLTLSGIRQAYINGTNGASSVDFDRRLESVREIIAYVPRALQIGYLSPFPNQWFGEGSNSATTAMRRVSMVEMLIVYAALAMLPLFVWRRRRFAALWVVLAYSGMVITIFAIATPNVGTLYRIRYGFLMPAVSLGILAAIEWWRAHRATDHGAAPSGPPLGDA